MFLRARKSAILLALVSALTGCSSMPSPADVIDKPSPGSYVEMAAHNKLIDHPSAVVSGPAGFGLGLGTIIGIPVMIVALPVTLPLGIAAFTDDPKTSNLQILGNAIAFPDAICAVGGAYAFGGVPYMIVGDEPKQSRAVRAPVVPTDGDEAPAPTKGARGPHGLAPDGGPAGPPPGLEGFELDK